MILVSKVVALVTIAVLASVSETDAIGGLRSRGIAAVSKLWQSVVECLTKMVWLPT